MNRCLATLTLLLHSALPGTATALQCIPVTDLTPLSPDGQQDDTQPEDCDTTRHPPPPDFQLMPSIPGALRLDIRPGNCLSWFDLPDPLQRGQSIERALSSHTLHAGHQPTTTFSPLIDLIQDQTVIVIQSHDLTSARFNDPTRPETLAEVIRDTANRLAALLAGREPLRIETAQGPSTLDPRLVQTAWIEIVIQHGMASDEQRRTLMALQSEFLSRPGIALRIIEIP